MSDATYTGRVQGDIAHVEQDAFVDMSERERLVTFFGSPATADDPDPLERAFEIVKEQKDDVSEAIWHLAHYRDELLDGAARTAIDKAQATLCDVARILREECSAMREVLDARPPAPDPGETIVATAKARKENGAIHLTDFTVVDGNVTYPHLTRIEPLVKP